MLQVLGSVADFANLVCDPEFEPGVHTRGHLWNHFFFTAVLEHDAHVALSNFRLVAARRIGVNRRHGLKSGVFGALPQFVRIRLDEGELELAAARSLVLLQEVGQVANEHVQLCQTAGYVGVDLDGFLEVTYQATTTHAQRIALGVSRIDTSVGASRQHIDRDCNRGHNHQIQSRLGRNRPLSFLRRHSQTHLRRSRARNAITNASTMADKKNMTSRVSIRPREKPSRRD